MSFDYSCLNLEALAAPSKNCTCENRDKLEAMNEHLLQKILKGEITSVTLGGVKFNLVRHFELKE